VDGGAGSGMEKQITKHRLRIAVNEFETEPQGRSAYQMILPAGLCVQRNYSYE
jgi:hypothetical protein